MHFPAYDERLVVFLRLYALCMADRLGDAEKLARDRLASTRLDREDRAFLDWLTATFGFTSGLDGDAGAVGDRGRFPLPSDKGAHS